jgi:hypothetical protein
MAMKTGTCQRMRRFLRVWVCCGWPIASMVVEVVMVCLR